MYRIFPNLRAGLSWMPRDNRASPVWNWRLREGTTKTPAIVLGQSTAWPSSKVSGEAYSLTFAQPINEECSAYVSASYAPDGPKWYVPAGVNWAFTEQWVARLLWDGVHLHPAISHTRGAWNFGFMLLDGKDPTITTSFAF